MVIKASSARKIDGLVADLRSDRAVTREAASVQLTVIGSRAVERLLALASDASPAARAAALRTLEAIADPRALTPALAAIDDPDVDVAIAAIGTARAFLREDHGAAVVDRLTEVALDRPRHQSLRLAAIRALAELEPSTVKPLLDALGDDPNEVLRAAADPAARSAGRIRRSPAEDLLRATQGGLEDGLGDDPAAIRQAIADATSAVPLPALLGLVKHAREREASAPPGRRGEWIAVRGTAHVALAKRRSRLAIYDLRESLETAVAPLPADFLAALSAVGDASCLEPIAAVYTRVPAGGNGADARSRQSAWRHELAETFGAIVRREGLTRRHGVAKKIRMRWPDAAGALWPSGPGRS